MNEKLDIDVKTLKPFTKFIYTIGELPTSYLMSMTYEEQLVWLCNYLTQTIIPTINNNAEAVKEVQDLVLQLQEYINNYFDNLDVQEEINNKLDEMALSGELTEIIAQYLQLAGILAFNTLNDLKNATNIADGSFTKTYGKITYNDGYGEFYKIRLLINTDVIDNDNLVTLTNYPTLVAEKINNTILNNLDNNVLTELVVIGDSYSAFSVSTWAEDLASQLHLTLHKYAQSSMGYVHEVNNKTFIDLLPENTNFANKVKYVICYGGINDYDATRSQIETNVDLFIKKAIQLFPNAEILIVGPQMDANLSVTNSNRYNNQVIGIERACLKNGVSYTDASEWLRNTEYLYTETYDTDRLHPSSLGYKIITSKMLSIINNDVNDTTKIKISLEGGLNGICHYKNCKGYTHFSAKINNITINKDNYTKILLINGLSDININTNLQAYILNNEYYPVYKIDSNNNVSEFIGCGRITSSSQDGSYYITMVGKTDTFTGNIAISGDIYYNCSRSN